MIINLKKRYRKMIDWLLSATSDDEDRPTLQCVNKRGDLLEATNGFVVHQWDMATDDPSGLLELSDGMYTVETLDYGNVDFTQATGLNLKPFPDTEKLVNGVKPFELKSKFEKGWITASATPWFISKAAKGFSPPMKIEIGERCMVMTGQARVGYGECTAIIMLMSVDTGDIVKIRPVSEKEHPGLFEVTE